jgi:hypothetical protein
MSESLIARVLAAMTPKDAANSVAKLILGR